jgi:hypothetical protein
MATTAQLNDAVNRLRPAILRLIPSEFASFAGPYLTDATLLAIAEAVAPAFTQPKGTTP